MVRFDQNSAQSADVFSLSIGQVVQQLQKQLENQKDVLKQYEPRLKKKEKEAKELTKVQYKNQSFGSHYLCFRARCFLRASNQ
jgi:hypothetical protein